MTENLAPQPATPPPPKPLAGVGVAAAVVVAIVGWLVLGGSLLSEASLFGGLLMLWYWANIEQLALRRLPSAIFGALVGIGLAWGMFYGATHYGPSGLAIGLILLVVAIYLDIIKVVPLFVNGATMLYSIIAAAPLVQLKVNWIELCIATIGGGVFFGAFVAVAGWLGKRLAA
jgi:hypothetical protein